MQEDGTFDVSRCDGTTGTVVGHFGSVKTSRAEGADQPFRVFTQSFYFDITEDLRVGDSLTGCGRTYTVRSITCSPAVCRCVAELVYSELFGCFEDIELYTKTHRPGCENGAENALLAEVQAIVWLNSSSTDRVLGAERFVNYYRFYLVDEFLPNKDTIVWWDNRGFRVEDVIDYQRPLRVMYLLAKEIAWQPSTTCYCLSS